MLRDECRVYFACIRNALERKGDMPRALEALRHLEEAENAVARVDDRERYLKETLEPRKGTILIYLEGDKNRPIRKKVLGVTEGLVSTEWHEVKMQWKKFRVSDRLAVEGTRPGRAPDELDVQELQTLLASLPRPRA